MAVIRRIASTDAPGRLLAEVRGLLHEAFVGDFSDDDWQHTLGGCHVMVEVDGAVVSHAAVVPRILHVADQPVKAGYVEGLATAPAHRRRGLGSQTMAEVAAIVRERFEIGALSTELTGFYDRLGWEVWRGPTFVREGDRLVRTEDEDGGVMVLRSGPTTDLDLEAPISCESRAGDDW